MTGLDAIRLFLDLARRDMHGDMRALPWTGRFDRGVNWFPSFGYFDDAVL